MKIFHKIPKIDVYIANARELGQFVNQHFKRDIEFEVWNGDDGSVATLVEVNHPIYDYSEKTLEDLKTKDKFVLDLGSITDILYYFAEEKIIKEGYYVIHGD